MLIISIILVEAMALFLAMRLDKSLSPLHVLILVNMLLIARFGGWLADFGIGISNYGNIFYATVVAAQYAILQRGGRHLGTICFSTVFAALLLSFCITGIMSAGPVIPGNETMVSTYRKMLALSEHFAFASFGAFITGQIFFIAFYAATEKLGVWVNYVVNMAVTQAIDSVVFFSLAFGLDAASIRIMATGYVIKVGIDLLALPAAWSLRKPEP